MLKRQFIIATFLLFFGLISGIKVWAQLNISVEANNLPLNAILNDVAAKYKIRFAYNDDIFSQIQTTISLKNVSANNFLDDICRRFGLNYRYIGGTYVIYIADEIKVMEAINTTISNKNKIESDALLPPPELKEEYMLSGIVKNAKTGEKLNYCSLEINKTIKCSTNEMGYFAVQIEPGDSAHIHINHLGYQQLDTLLKIATGIPIDLQVYPIEFLEPMKGIGFRRYKFIVALPEVPEIIEFNPKSTLQVPALEPNDLMNALTVLPGINYLKGTETGLSIRGGAPSDNLVLIDGIPVIETSHLMGNLSVLNAKYIQQAFVSRGGFGAEYGGRTSGIVDLTGKSGNNDVAVVDFTANSLHTNIYVGLPITEKSSLSGSFKKSFVDVWSNYLLKNFALENKIIETQDGTSGDAYVDKTIVNYTDANVKLSIRPTNRNEITLNYFSSYDAQLRDYNYLIDGNYQQFNNSKSNTSGYSFNYKSQNHTGWMNTFSVGYNKLQSSSIYEYTKATLVKDQLVKPFFDTDHINLQELRASYKSEYKSKKFTHQYGVGFNSDQLDFRYEDYEIKIVGANNFNDSIAAKSSVQLANSYYQLKFFPMKWISIRGGVRGLYNLNKGLFSFQPRYGVEIIPNQKMKMYYSGGRYVQHLYLAYRIDSYHNISPIWFIPKSRNQNLDAIHHIVGTRIESNNFLLNVELYHKVNSNKIYFVGENTVVDGLPTVAYQPHTGAEMNRGADLFFQYQTSIFKHLISYSLSESFEKAEGINNYDFFPSIDHQLHRLRLTEIVNLKGWTASVNWYYASGAPFLMSTSTATQLNFDVHPNYMQVDVGLVKQFHFHNFFADLGITVLNVTDRRNAVGLKNLTIAEGTANHLVSTTTLSTAFSPLFYINLRYE